MRARSTARRQLVARLAVVLIAASLTVACTSEAEPEPELTSSEPEVVAVVEPMSESTAPPIVQPTAVPSATTALVKPLSTPSALRPVPPEPYFIGNTLGRGMSLRQAPTSADLVKAWPDGTMMEGLGAQQDAQGWTWAWVRDPEGNAGWMPTQFLVRSPDEPSAPLPLTPAPAEISVSLATLSDATSFHPANVGPTAVVTVLPVSTTAPAPKPKSEAVATASRWYTSLGNSLNIVGIVENRGTEPVVLKKIALSLLSDSGMTVGALNAVYQPTVL